MAVRPARCGNQMMHGPHTWEEGGRRNYCGGAPELSQDPKDSVANSIAIGKAFREQREALQVRDEALRELLSHCRTRATDPRQDPGAYGELTEVADRLAKILDGEN